MTAIEIPTMKAAILPLLAVSALFAQPGPTWNNADGPWNRDVIAWRVSASGAVEKAATFERAGVPTIARVKDGRLIAAFQNFPADDNRNFDRVAVRFSSDEGRTWTTAQPIAVEGMEPGLARPFDPTLVPLPDGRIRLYFTSNRSPDFRRSTPAIYSAISKDGIHYEFEPGVRFAVEGRLVIDCAVVLHQDVFHLYVPDNGTAEEMFGGQQRREPPPAGSAYHATSTDGLTFKRVDEVKVAGNRRWLGNAQSDGKLITFYGTGDGIPTGGPGGQPRGGLWMATSADGQSWKLAASPPISGGDPGAVTTLDGGLIVVITSETVRRVTPNRVNAAPQDGRGEFNPRPDNRADGRNVPPLQAGEGRGEGGRRGQQFQPQQEPFGARREIRVEQTGSTYRIAPGAKPGSFTTGQNADIVLGSKGFNNSGGSLLFNHPTGLATDGKALLMTDRWNNRVLIWKSAPATNTPPDLVLGQPDFTQNNPGTGKHQMNWPGNVAITPDGKRIAVTDTDNDRILIWNSFPTRNGQAADLVLDLARLSGGAPPSGPAQRPDDAQRRFPNQPGSEEARGQRAGPEAGAPQGNFRPQVGRGLQRFSWPWGVWTDGAKLAVVATHGSAVLIWHSLPTRDHQPPDLVLRPDDAGTPRNVTSDGKTFFAVSDHNHREWNRPATMVWNSFPTSATQPPDWTWSEWVKGSFTPGGGMALAGIQSVYLWNKPPRNAETDADVVLRPATYRNGDGPDAVVANGRLYVCTYNGNHILGWNALPTRDNQPPDFALGSDRTDQDTWAENFFIQNPVVATDGKSLFVTSDFDRKMFVWRNLPDESAAKPDLVMHLPDGPWDNELHGSTLALAGRNTVSIWKKLPLNGEPPDLVLNRRIGSVELGDLTGVAFDDQYFYLADRRSESIYVWEGIPNQDSEPKFTLAMRSPGRLTSDGNYLCAAPFEGGGIQLWRVSELSSRAEPITLGGRGQFNLPSECLIAEGRLFVCNRSFNRVDVWDRVEDALAGRLPDALLGAADESDRQPAIGRNQLFMPGSVAWGGGYLWVGEFKFSTRILRFSPQATAVRSNGQRRVSPDEFIAGVRPTEASRTEAAPSTKPSSHATLLNQMWSRGQAAGKGPVRLKTFPLRAEDLRSVIPMGMMVHGHVIPSDHLSLQPKDRDASSDRYEVLAPADGFIVDIHRPPAGNPDPGVRSYSGDFRIVIEHSATCYSWLGLVDRLDEKVLQAIGGAPAAGTPVGVRVPVKAGQVIGRMGGAHGLDYTLINTEATLTGFIKPAQFLHRDQWKPHVVDPFPFLDGPEKARLLALNPRRVEPRGGRIDHDVDGALAGNWYREGTGGYAGLNRRMDYWVGHLAFAYHHIDPTQLVVSIGDYDGKPRQFWVKGNVPDPANVSEKDGVVKYELIWGRLNNSGQPSDGIPASVQGTALAQVLPERKLKFEAFPGKTGAEVKGFTSAAKIYER